MATRHVSDLKSGTPAHLSWLLAWHGRPHIDGGPTGAKGWRRDVGWERGPRKYNSGVGLTAVRRWRGSGRGGSGCVGACGGRGRAGCEAVTRRDGLRGDWLACCSSGSSGSTGSYSSRILTDLLHKIPHKVGWKATYSHGGKEKSSHNVILSSEENSQDFRD